jgi:ABC-2 type transport system ATP-binding protein
MGIPDSTAPAIQVRGLVKKYGDVTAVAGIDLDVLAGECFGLLGPNGAGKTTTVEILEGLLPQDEGEVRILGEAWTRRSHSLRQRLGIALQETHLADRQTVAETVGLFRSFYAQGRELDDVISMVGLQEKRDAWVMKLSGGQRQRLAIACALVGAPDLLFLDEPTTGLDPQSRRNLWDVVAAFREKGGTCVLTTHYMEEAERLCDRVAIIDHGRIIALGTPAELIGQLGGTEVVQFQASPNVDEVFCHALPGVTGVQHFQGRWRLTVEALHRTVPALVDGVRQQGVELTSLTTHQASLEDVFIHLTGRALRGDA